MMEGMILLLAWQMSVSAVARLLRTTDQRLSRVIDPYVMAAHRDKDWSKVRRILADKPRRRRDSLPQAARRASAARQTSAHRGRRYVTYVFDAESKDLLMMAKDRGAEALGEFAAAMTEALPDAAGSFSLPQFQAATGPQTEAAFGLVLLVLVAHSKFFIRSAAYSTVLRSNTSLLPYTFAPAPAMAHAHSCRNSQCLQPLRIRRDGLRQAVAVCRCEQVRVRFEHEPLPLL